VATKKSAATKKKSARSQGKSASKKRWVKHVTTDSTHPPKDLFTKSAPAIARGLASKKVSPKGPGSGMRMLTYFINRAGKGLSASRRRELERAKKLLHERIEKEKQREKKTAA
jgi:tRNA(adenine34) deaminase